MSSMLREMGQLLLQWTYKAFTDNILLSHPWKIADYIADDLSNATPGYSFVSNTRNHQFYNRKSFLTFIMNTPKLRDEFVTANSVDGTLLLNLGCIKTWLDDYTDELLYLMVTIEVLAGSSSWGTELTCIQLRNTSCQTCGIYNIGHHMAIVVQYLKMSSRDGRDTLIPHILDAFCQDVIKTVTFVTHLFAEQMSRILYPDCNNITTLWHNHLFVKKDTLFTTKDISSVLQHASLETMQIKLGIQDYRQLSICVKHAHCSTLEELIGMREDVNVAAQQASHSGATEERMYGVSTDYLGSLPKNLIEPYANASAEWQVLMKVPEGGKNVYMYQYPNKEL